MNSHLYDLLCTADFWVGNALLLPLLVAPLGLALPLLLLLLLLLPGIALFEEDVDIGSELRDDDDDDSVVGIEEVLTPDTVEEYDEGLEDTDELLVLDDDDEMIFFAWAEMDFRLTR